MPRAGQPETFFLMLRSVADGTLLASASGSCDHDPPCAETMQQDDPPGPSCAITLDRVDDHGCWRAEGNAAEDGCLLSNVARPQLRLRCAFRGGGARAAADCEHPHVFELLHEASGQPAARGGFEAVRGPAEPPSATLAHLEAHGWALLPALLPPAIVDEVGTASPWDGGPGRDAINETPAVAAAALHPVLLELLERYIGSPIHLGHTPTATALPPGNGSTGWHSVSAEPITSASRPQWPHPRRSRPCCPRSGRRRWRMNTSCTSCSGEASPLR